VASGVRKAAYATLLQDLREAVDRDANVTGLPKLLLSTSICAQPYIISDAYDIPTLVRCVRAHASSAARALFSPALCACLQNHGFHHSAHV
jgi:hypothetical protein